VLLGVGVSVFAADVRVRDERGGTSNRLAKT